MAWQQSQRLATNGSIRMAQTPFFLGLDCAKVNHSQIDDDSRQVRLATD
jgi:hypothetical protein